MSSSHRAALPLRLAALVALAAATAAFAQGIPGVPSPRGSLGATAPGAAGAPGAPGAARSSGAARPGDPVVKVSVVPARRVVMPGDRLPIAVVFDLAKGWHIWTSEAQESRLPESIARFDGAQLTRVQVEPQRGGISFEVDAIQWPEYHLVSADLGEGPQNFAVYEGRAIAFLPIIVAADAAKGPFDASITVAFQACNDSTCMMPEETSLPLRLEVESPETIAGDAGPGADGVGDADPALFEGFDYGVFARIDAGDASLAPPLPRAARGARATPNLNELRFRLFSLDFTIDTRGAGRVVIILMALAGGMLLNLTPCVLPVIPLKVMSLTQMAGSRARSIALSTAMAGGIVAFWMVLGGLMASLRGFDAISALFQIPWVTLGIGLLVAFMAIAMSGFFTFALPGFVYAFEPKHDSMGGSFMVGIMTAVLSTPCTGPFMGASLGWAQAIESVVMLLLIFLAIGVGMAAPYVVLASLPELVKKVPKAGPASELVKQTMGLLLLAAALYFICTGLAGLFGWRSMAYWWIVVLPAIAAGLWLMWRTVRISRRTSNRLIFGSIGAAIVAISAGVGHVFAGVALSNDEVPMMDWPLYSAQAEREAIAEGKVVVLKFTAHWCLSCKVLEKAVLSSPRVVDRLSRPDVRVLSVDITGGEPEQKERLKEAGSVTIPLLVVMAPNGARDPAGEEIFRSDAYTIQQVIDAVDEAAAQARRVRAQAGR